MMERTLNKIKIRVIEQDITTLAVDGIVISASPQLDLDSEIGQAVLLRGGPRIWDECDLLGSCEVGNAVITGAGSLPCKYIIHAVGPQMGMGGERGKLASAVWNALRVAVQQGLHTVAFSPISTGRFGYPVEGCANVMAQKIVDFTFEDAFPLTEIIICLNTTADYPFFEHAFRREIDAAQDEASTGS